MGYFDTRDIAAVSISASLWAVLNWLVAPIFWELTHTPILCDMIGTSQFVLTLWWTKKPGSVTFMGVVATVLNFILRPGALHFLGFTASSIVFDAAAVVLLKKDYLDSIRGALTLVILSLISTFVAGAIIGSFFMNPLLLSNMYGGVIFFAGLHAAGGVVGGTLGVVITKGLDARQVFPR